ncbi:hypothetical protein Psta_1150 [Pirellula staleyi DSM 6068]|uniref:Uncharacterized protein n=1 Tax=Pirellula staleyi (strain ATCC 27377 / DSM 6068 / ICPB 4128) TaxID=530564 RepID=D2R905_PIRSD|nr:hypothetical protein Psta_1150 [Pirellula staleyi DSM 6068]
MRTADIMANKNCVYGTRGNRTTEPAREIDKSFRNQAWTEQFVGNPVETALLHIAVSQITFCITGRRW